MSFISSKFYRELILQLNKVDYIHFAFVVQLQNYFLHFFSDHKWQLCTYIFINNYQDTAYIHATTHSKEISLNKEISELFIDEWLAFSKHIEMIAGFVKQLLILTSHRDIINTEIVILCACTIWNIVGCFGTHSKNSLLIR